LSYLNQAMLHWTNKQNNLIDLTMSYLLSQLLYDSILDLNNCPEIQMISLTYQIISSIVALKDLQIKIGQPGAALTNEQ